MKGLSFCSEKEGNIFKNSGMLALGRKNKGTPLTALVYLWH